MKSTMKTTVALVLAVCLLLAALPVTADRYEWHDGQIPAGWDRITDAEDLTATNILTPINPNASQEAKNLYAYLCTLTDTNQFITGQFDILNDNDIWERNIEQLGFEAGLYSNRYLVDTSMPTFDPNNPAVITNSALKFGEVQRANALLKKHYDQGNVLLLHADDTYRDTCSKLLIQKGLYRDAANGIVELDACNPDRDMQTYALWVRYMDNVVESLTALESLGVKAYMYRALIEFNYNTFYGVTEAGYAAFTRVYQQTVQTLIDSGLTGFLSTYSPGHKIDTLQQYPGNEYVDVLSATLYSEWDLLGTVDRGYGFPNYEWYVKTGKPIGFSECSCRDGNVSENQEQARASWYSLLQEIVTKWPRISWVNVWADTTFSMLNNAHMPEDGNDDGMAFLTSPYTLNLPDLVDYRSVNVTAPGVAQFYLKGENTYRGLEERAYTAANLKAMGISLSDLAALRMNEGYAVTFYADDGCTGESWVYVKAAKVLSATLTAQFRSCEVAVLKNEDESNTLVTSALTALGGAVRNRDTHTGTEDYDLRFGFSLDNTTIAYASTDPVALGNYLRTGGTVLVDSEAYTVTDMGTILTTEEDYISALANPDNLSGNTRDVKADRLYAAEDGTITFTAVVTNIPYDHADTTIYVRGYVQCEDVYGHQVTLMSNPLGRSVHDVLDAAEL